MAKSTEKAVMVGGVALIGGLAAGFASVIVAIFAFFSMNWIGAGVSLGAAGLSFGLIANAIWRE